MSDKYPPMPTSLAEWHAHWAFYKLTVQQRDAAWREIEQVRTAVTPASAGPVTVLSIDHRHGTDVNVYTSRAAAHAALVGYVHEWWNEWVGRVGDGSEPLPAEPPADGEEAIRLYFDAAAGTESYWIEDTTIRAEPAPATPGGA